MKRTLMRLLLLLGVVLTIGEVSAYAAGSTILCKNVSTVATLLSAKSSRLSWSIWTTSGAATIYFRQGGNAAIPPADGTDTSSSAPLTGGLSYTDDKGPWTGSVTAVSKTGTNWVCVKENF